MNDSVTGISQTVRFFVISSLAIATVALAVPPEVGVFEAVAPDRENEHCLWQGPTADELSATMLNQNLGPGEPEGGPSEIHRIVCRIHIVRRSDGSGGFDEALIPKMMEDLNVGFRDTPFRYVREPGVVYIDNDAYYEDFPTFSSAFPMLFEHFEPGIMSWYITPCINGCTAVAGTWIGPASPVRGILMAYFTAGSPANIVTPTHEMGHIFQMYHPYETVFGQECTSGSNCTNAGDLICDTPASPIVHGGNTTATGIYFANEPGPCAGDPPFDPNPRLYMDAGWPAGHILRNQFSPGEVERAMIFLDPDAIWSVYDLIGPDRPDILVDCDGNGVDDVDEINAGEKADLGRDLVPDVCQTFPEPRDLVVCGMNNEQTNRPRYFDGDTGEWRGDLWNGMTWAHQLRMGPDGLVYMARLTIIQRISLATGRTVDNFIDGILEGAGTFVDLLFEPSGDILVMDQISMNVRRYDGDTGEYLGDFIDLSFIPSFGAKYLEFGPDGHIYVVGGGNGGNTVYVFDSTSGESMGTFFPPGSGGLITGQGLVFHTDGFLYVSNGAGNSVLRYNGSTGDFDRAFVPASANGGLSNPHSLRFGPDGHLYVASRGTHSVKRYDGESGEYLGDFVAPGAGGTPGSGGLVQPSGLLFVPSCAEYCGDGDEDGDIDRFDLASLLDCVTGPGAGEISMACAPFDITNDQDVDFEDFAAFQRLHTGVCGINIIEQPQDAGACLGAAAEMSVAAVGENLAFQWQFNGEDIPNATGDTLVIESMGESDVGTYRSIIGGNCDESTVTADAELSILPETVLTTQPTGGTFCVGDTVFIFVGTTGADTFQWYKDGEPIEGANTAFLAIPNVQESDAGDYHVVATGPCNEVISDAASVTVEDCGDGN